MRDFDAQEAAHNEGNGMNIALKEWAVVVEALGAGRQLFLLRKGGIAESKRGFELQHRQFVFFPTWEHQQRDGIQPEFHGLFDGLEPRSSDSVEIRYLAQVTDILRAPPREQMERLRHHFIWADSYLQMRYGYRPDLPLFAVVIRVFRLPQTIEIPNDRRYAGCRSWVELYSDLPVENAQAVIETREFESARNVLLGN
jgi:hypothetical protein